MRNVPKLFLTAALVFAGFFCNAQTRTDAFIKKYLPLAQELKIQYGIPISLMFGVSIVESGSGGSINAKDLNNFFGVKGGNKLKKRKSAYKAYLSGSESFREFCAMLSRKPYYNQLRGNDSYAAWLKAMNSKQYAGAKGQWITDIKSVIRTYNLSLYDK